MDDNIAVLVDNSGILKVSFVDSNVSWVIFFSITGHLRPLGMMIGLDQKDSPTWAMGPRERDI
ncbi:hypothetical protein SUZIE_107990 [Sciurus carolinensis]|uniref:Uncharacterized protein n=1 Tax=Sciurus carolinensis TaxID=30640 RepID=A0AA41SN30_SCICA|nr:hypothetical protein [Sciurus carolinensis]